MTPAQLVLIDGVLAYLHADDIERARIEEPKRHVATGRVAS